MLLIAPDVAAVKARLDMDEKTWSDKDFDSSPDGLKRAKIGDLYLTEVDRLSQHVDKIAELEPRLSDVLLQMIGLGAHYNVAAKVINEQESEKAALFAFEKLREPMNINREVILKLANSAIRRMAIIHDTEIGSVEEKEKA